MMNKLSCTFFIRLHYSPTVPLHDMPTQICSLALDVGFHGETYITLEIQHMSSEWFARNQQAELPKQSHKEFQVA